MPEPLKVALFLTAATIGLIVVIQISPDQPYPRRCYDGKPLPWEVPTEVPCKAG